MKRNGFASLMAAMRRIFILLLAAGLAASVLSSCSDDDDDDDEPVFVQTPGVPPASGGASLLQTIAALDSDGKIVFIANFYDDNTWIAYNDANIKLMDGTYTGTPVASSTVSVTALHYLDSNGNYGSAPSKPAQSVTIGSDGKVSNLSDVQGWINSFYE